MKAAGASTPAAPATRDFEDAVARLVRELAQGNRQALSSLYKLTVHRLWALALGLVLQQELAEALLEEVFVQVWATASAVELGAGSGSAWHWICGICHQQARTLRRRTAQEA